MRFSLKLYSNIHNLMRHCGYHFERKNKEELVFSRIIGQSKPGYPRFHAYVKVNPVSQQTLFNLHFDQKKPIYKGAAAHSAEYEGKLLEEEVERIKKIVEGL